MNKKLLYCLLLGRCFIYNAYSMDQNSIGICRNEKLGGYEYQNTDLSTLKFENIKKLVFTKKGCFDNSKKLKTLIFEHNDININIPNGVVTIPSLLNPNKDLGLPLDCHVRLKSDIENSAQRIEDFSKRIKDQTPTVAINNFARSLKHSVDKNSLNIEDIDYFGLEITFFIVNECSTHNWYLNLTDHSYTAVSYISEKNAHYRNVLGANIINGEYDMAAFYRSNEYKFALSIYEFLSAASRIDSGNIYERTLNAIINATQDQYTISMCNAIKDAYMFVENLDAGIHNLERQIYEKELEKQRILEQERIRAAEQKRIREAEKKAAKEAKRLAEAEAQRKKEFKQASIAMNQMFNLIEDVETLEISKSDAILKLLKIISNNVTLLEKYYSDKIGRNVQGNIVIDLNYYNVIIYSDLSTLTVRQTDEHPVAQRMRVFDEEVEQNRSNWLLLRIINWPINFVKKLYTAYGAAYEYAYNEEKYKMFLED